MRFVHAIVIVLLASAAVRIVARAESPTGRRISEDSITRLRQQFAATENIESSTEKRRACKNVVRRAERLLDGYPAAPNRFDVLGIVFEGRKALFTMSSSEAYRQAFLGTAQKLLEAPDEYAKLRIQAEVVLLQVDLARKGATQNDSALAIAKLADRYRDTPAEAESLMIASLMAFDIGHEDLLKAFRAALSARSEGNREVADFLRERFAKIDQDVRFRGTFTRADGGSVCFPIDRMGHVYLLCFWSQQTSELNRRLSEIKALQVKHPGRFQVFSFNLDELPDAGQKKLRLMGLDWIPLHFPGGVDNPQFRVYGRTDTFLLRAVNASGYSTMALIGQVKRGGRRILNLQEYVEFNLEESRFLALMQSMRTGDFLVTDPSSAIDISLPPELKMFANDRGLASDVRLKRTDASMPADTLGAIQACFRPPSHRYRMTTEEALKSYRKAESLCADALKRHANAPDLWIVFNRRIIALLGMWDLTGEEAYLKRAVETARAALGMAAPAGARVVPRFCLARNALRKDDPDSGRILADFMKAGGGPNVSGAALAAAAILALDAGRQDLYLKYRMTMLEKHAEHPMMSPFLSFLRDRYVSSRQFRATSWGDTRERAGLHTHFASSEDVVRSFHADFKTLDGRKLEFPRDAAGRLNVVVFMEPPAGAQSARIQREVMQGITGAVAGHLHKDVNVIAAFLCDDAAKVRRVMSRNKWKCQGVIVPAGLGNPLVSRLGIMCADQRPNTFLVRPDGVIAWAITGLTPYAGDVSCLAGRVRQGVQAHDKYVADIALQRGDFQEAAKRFTGSYPPRNPRRPARLTNAQLFGRARAYKGLKDWQAALADLNTLVGTHERYSRGRRCMCHSLQEKLLVRADLLDKLDKSQAARQDRLRAASLTCPPGNTRKYEAKRYEPDMYRVVREFMDREDWKGGFAYIDDIIRHDRDGQRSQRRELASWLRERGEVQAQLGQSAQAKLDRARAEALVGAGQASQSPTTETPRNKPRASNYTPPARYVDLVSPRAGEAY